MNEKKSQKVIIALVAIIVILLLVLIYAFLLKPQFNGYVIQKQIDAQNLVLNALLTQLQQKGYVQISDPQGNSIILAPVQQQPPQQVSE